MTNIRNGLFHLSQGSVKVASGHPYLNAVGIHRGSPIKIFDGLIDPALPEETFLRSFMWLIFGYFVTGPIDWQGWFSDPLDPAHLAELRRLVHGFIRHGLEQPWPNPPAGRDGTQKD